MAECNGSQLSVDWFGLKTVVVNMSEWTNGKDSHQNESWTQVIKSKSSESGSDSDHQKRSDIVHAIIHNRSLVHLDSILGSGWDINEPLTIPDHINDDWEKLLIAIYRQRTALGEAARQRWTEGVKMLLDAGAKCKTSDELENPITLALRNRDCPPDLRNPDCPPDLIELLLQHGVDPNDAQLKPNPLIQAIENCRHSQNLRIVQLLLEHGANLKVTHGRPFDEEHPLSAALQCREFEVFSALFRMLIKFGADVNYTGPQTFPLLHNIMNHSTNHRFRKEQRDVFFLHGGNINMEAGRHGTVLEHAVSFGDNNNIIRWLIRYGADTSTMKVTLLKSYFIPKYYYHWFPETPLILLHAGMRVSHGAVTQLSNMEMAISTWLLDNSTDVEEIDEVIHTYWAQLEEAEEGELQRMQYNLRKSTFPEYWTRQMADLQEFSDKSLHVYPQDSHTFIKDRRKKWQHMFHNIHTILEILSQSQSLQSYCRRCVRENLVSLQPSVVKMLLIPATLKRYILCHEI